MYEVYTHFANILIANFTNNNEVLNTIRDILKNSDVEGAASITQYNYISIKILGYNSDKLMQVSDKISEYLMDLDVN